MRIVCPHCGLRGVEEFEFRTFAPSGSTAFERTYERVNEPERTSEHWQHVHGCRAWLVIERNPSAGEVHTARALGASS